MIEKAKGLKFVSTTIKGAYQGELKLLIARRHIAYGRVRRPVSFRVVADKDVWQNGVTHVSGANSEGERRRNRIDLFSSGKGVNPILMIEDDALENLE